MPPPTEYIKINTDGAFGANNSGTGEVAYEMRDPTYRNQGKSSWKSYLVMYWPGAIYILQKSKTLEKLLDEFQDACMSARSGRQVDFFFFWRGGRQVDLMGLIKQDGPWITGWKTN